MQPELVQDEIAYSWEVCAQKQTDDFFDGIEKRHGFEEFIVLLTINGRIGMALSPHRDLVGSLPNTIMQLGINHALMSAAAV